MQPTKTWRIASLALLLAGAIGCAKGAPGATTPVANDDAPTASAAAPAVALGPGEALAEARDQRTTELAWQTPAGPVVLAAIARGETVVVRAFGAGGPVDVTTAMPLGDTGQSLEATADGTAVIFTTTSLAGHVAEAGALLAYGVARIEWDDAAGRPVVRDTWSCDETVEDDGVCHVPAWAEPDAR